MARVIRKGKQDITESNEVKVFLKERNVDYSYWEVPVSVNSLIQKGSLSAYEKEELLLCLDTRFQFLKENFGYKTRDLVVLHPSVPGLEGMLAKFDKVHYHTDDEVRYIVDGSGIFGFALQCEKFLVHVEKSDYISVPKNTNHWFYLDKQKRIKAIRYFSDMSGWVPNYVNETNSIE
jgi:1,2-dihydroxy-3-keto-5-methylthiopentene dioxygenase